MIKVFKLGLLFALATLVGGAQTTTTYTGTIKDLAQNVVTSGQVTFTLAPPVDSTVPGIGRFTPTTVPCNINANGTLSGYVAGVVSGACIVTNNTSISPTGTSYQICVQAYFATPGSCFYDYATGGSRDISTVAPTLSTGPVNYAGTPGPPGPPGGLSSPAVFYATDSASLASALTQASAYTTSTGLPSSVNVGSGNFNLASQFSEPMVNGSGVSIIGVPGSTNIFMSANNAGTPWEGMIFRGASSGNTGYFTISGLNLYCTNSATTSMNALFGIEVQNGKNVHISHVQTQNCGSLAAGGAGIATGGGGVTDETQIWLEDILVNYNEGFYTGPAGGAGPTPAANGIALRGSTGDSVLHNILVRNPHTCGIAVLHKGTNERSTGGIVIDTAHVFGFASSIPVPIPYFPQYGYCEQSDFGGDRWLNVEIDSVGTSGFYIDTKEVGGTTGINSIQIVSPTYYWWTATGGDFSPYTTPPLTTPPNLMSLSSTAVGHVDVINAVCTNHAYTASSGTPITNASLITPAFYGGTGCGLQDKDGYMNLISPINVGGANGENILGDGSNVGNYWSMSSRRAAFGYGLNGGAVVHATSGKQITFEIGSTFDSGTKLGVIDPTNGFLWGGAPGSATTANYRLDLSGIQAFGVTTGVASATTIAPTTKIVEVTGSTDVQTITPPAPVCTSSQSCEITLMAVNGFRLVTGGNISAQKYVPAGETIKLVYLANLSQWVVPRGKDTTPFCSAGSGTKVSLTAQTAAIGTTNMCTAAVSGTYRVATVLYITAVGTAGTISASLGGNNGAGGSTNFYGPSALSTTTLGGQVQQVNVFHIAAGQNLSYGTSFSGVTGTPQYGLDVVVEQLQ